MTIPLSSHPVTPDAIAIAPNLDSASDDVSTNDTSPAHDLCSLHCTEPTKQEFDSSISDSSISDCNGDESNTDFSLENRFELIAKLLVIGATKAVAQANRYGSGAQSPPTSTSASTVAISPVAVVPGSPAPSVHSAPIRKVGKKPFREVKARRARHSSAPSMTTNQLPQLSLSGS